MEVVESRSTDITHSPEVDRVRANTWREVNDRIERDAQLRLRRAAAMADSEVSERITELEREWDFDRVLETEAAAMGLAGLMFAVTLDKRLLVLPAFVSTMVLIHAVHGWYPLLPIFRRLGIRSRNEIDKERYALKMLRGDFESVPAAGTPAAERAAAAWRAVTA